MKKLFFALVCFVASFAFVSCGSSTPADVAADWIELVKNKDYKAFVETFNVTGDSAEEVEQQKQFLLGMFEGKAEKAIAKHGGIESYTLVSEEVAEDGNTAKVVYDITYTDGTKDKTKFNMVKVDGEWKNEVKK